MTLYDLLGVGPEATDKQIRAAYRRKAKAAHPDAGGESGPGARPMHPDWARSLRDQCQAAGVAFHFKQWGEWAPWWDGAPLGNALLVGKGEYRLVDGARRAQMTRVGKARAGRELDGRTWDEVPA